MIFRFIVPSEVDQAIAIEQICFPPHEACSSKSMRERIAAAPDMFLVAEDENSGLLVGFLNGIATDESRFRDEFFTDISLHNDKGRNVMLLGLDVLPEFRGRGLARELVKQYRKIAEVTGKKQLILTCLDEKVPMYLKMGFQDDGTANSTWGGEEWHEMRMVL